MAETLAPVDTTAILAEVTSHVPWIHDKVTAFRGLLIAVGGDPDLAQRRSVRMRLAQAGDSEFTDHRVALRFETQKAMDSVWHGRDAVLGYPTYDQGRTLEGPVSREIIDFVDEAGAFCFWTREGSGLAVHNVAQLLHAGDGTLTLDISASYRSQLTRN